MKSLSKISIFWLVFLISTTSFLSANNQYDIRGSRLILAQVLIFGLFIAEITGYIQPLRSYKNKWLMLFLIWLFFGKFIKNFLMHGYFNLIFPDEVTYLALINIILFVYLYITTSRSMPAVDVEKILKLFCWLGLFQIIWCIIQLLQYDSVFYDAFLLKDNIFKNRMVGTLENENCLGAYLSFILPLCFIWRKWQWNLLGIIGFVFILLTKSIMAISSGFAGLAVILFLKSTTVSFNIKFIKRRLYIKPMFIAVKILMAVILVICLKSHIISYQDKSLTVKFKTKQVFHLDLHASGRFQHWKESLQLAKPYSFTGIGIGKYKIAMPEFMKGQTARIYLQAHNDWLQLLCETGIIGFGLFMLFLGYIFKRLWKLRHNNLIQGITAGLIAFMVNACGFFPIHLIHLAGVCLFFFCATEIIYKEEQYA